MSRIVSILKKIKLDYKEFQITNQSMSEPWKENQQSKGMNIFSLFSFSGLNHFRISFGHAFKLWKLQIINRDEASHVIENFGKETNTKNDNSNDPNEVNQEFLKIADNIQNMTKDDITNKTNDINKNFKKNTKDTLQIYHDNKENMKEFTYDRLKIMSDALRAFNEGYQEGKTIGENEALEKSPEELYDDVLSKPIQDKINNAMKNIKKATDN